jgi:dTMP kinase
MNSNRDLLRNKLRKRVSVEAEGISHDLWHLDRVYNFACQLQSLYGGDLSIITAAVYLHDLGRSDTTLHGQDSIDKSLEYSIKILEDINYPRRKRSQVLLAIDEHDKPKTRPTSLEGRILKDADFLAGFGAVGVLRIALWAIESEENIEGIFDRLGHRMMERFRGLEFPVSEAWAIPEVAFAQLFLSQLRIPPLLQEHNLPGKYVVLEGISGTGKDTQIMLLKKNLQRKGYPIELVREPANEYKQIRKLWKKRHNDKINDPLINTFFLMADRYEQIHQKIRPAIEAGSIVISNRSYISNLIYQCNSDDEISTAIFAHKFVPIPDLIIFYDIDPDDAFERIKGRKTAGMFEKPDLMSLHRSRYLKLFGSGVFGKRVKTIDASQSLIDVEEQTLKYIEALLF